MQVPQPAEPCSQRLLPIRQLQAAAAAVKHRPGMLRPGELQRQVAMF
jgi:hypothetical protein